MFAAALGVFFGFEVLDSDNFFAVLFFLSQLTHSSFVGFVFTTASPLLQIATLTALCGESAQVRSKKAELRKLS
jgi:hypothetical protein